MVVSRRIGSIPTGRSPGLDSSFHRLADHPRNLDSRRFATDCSRRCPEGSNLITPVVKHSRRAANPRAGASAGKALRQRNASCVGACRVPQASGGATSKPTARAARERRAALSCAAPYSGSMALAALRTFRCLTVRSCPSDRISRSFLLHFGFDGWQHIADVTSEPQGLSMHGVRFDAATFLGRSTIDFTFYFAEQMRWEGADHHITIRHG